MEEVALSHFKDLDDSGKWPDSITDSVRTYLVKKGPMRVKLNFPRNTDGRKFSESYYYRKLTNGEHVNREWLIYSEAKDKVYCFCCRLFSVHYCHLNQDGFNDWKNLSGNLKQHELSTGHLDNIKKWYELKRNLDSFTTIDHVNQKKINAEKEHWRNVLKRIIAIILYLAENNDAFRGKNSVIYKENNGKFLALIEMVAKFDTVMQEHVRRIQSREIHDHYLGPQIQNELIEIIAKNIRQEIIHRIKKNKYFAVLLDCTPDLSHKEQMSLIIRTVESCQEETVFISEYFIGFQHINTSKTGENLANNLKSQIESLGLDLNNCRGQCYDNAANMVGKNKGVKSHILKEYPRAFFLPCSAHSLNLLLSDMAVVVPSAMTFFGTIQRIYTLFSASVERWAILLKHLQQDGTSTDGLTVKSISETRWECRLEAVKPIRFQISEINGALEEIGRETKDPKIKSEALSLASYEFTFEFVLSTVIWYDILSAINKVSKSLQSEKMDLATSIQFLSGLRDFLLKYRDDGFRTAKHVSFELCEEKGIDPTFKETRKCIKKQQFVYESKDTDVTNAETKFYRDYFLPVLDQGITSIDARFNEAKFINDNFGFLFNLQDIKQDLILLKEKCKQVKLLLIDDIDDEELYEELKLFINFEHDQQTKNNPLNYLKIINKTSNAFPNLNVICRIFLTLPITTATAERSFSKLKIIKNYLRTTMIQNRLSDLALISIEKKKNSRIFRLPNCD